MSPLFKVIGEGIDKFSKTGPIYGRDDRDRLGVAKNINILAGDYSSQLTAVLSILTGRALLDTLLAFTSSARLLSQQREVWWC